MKNIKRQAVVSFKWSAAKSLIEVILGSITLTILARLLGPKEYGYIAIVTILIGFSKQIAQLGFSQAIIQNDNVTTDDLDSIFWFEQFIAILTFVLVYFSSEYISLFFNAPETVELLKLSAFIFLLEPFDLVFRTVLKKELMFKILSKASIIRIIFQKISIIIFALYGFGAKSYIYGNLIGIFVLTIIMLIIFKSNKMWFPSFYFSISKVKPYLRFGLYITAKSIFNNLFVYLDEIIIGTLLGTDTLGIYHFAKNLISYIMRIISLPISEVTYPLLAKIKSNIEMFNNTYIKIIKTNAFFSIPAYIGIGIIAEFAIPIFFGDKWILAIDLVKILSIWGLFKTLYSGIITSALYSFGKSDWVFYATVIDLPIRGILMYFGSYYGINMIAFMLVLIVIIKFFVYQFVLKLITNIEIEKLLSELKYPLLSSIIMGVILILSNHFIIFNLLKYQKLIINIIVGIFSYILLIYILERNFVRNMILQLKK